MPGCRQHHLRCQPRWSSRFRLNTASASGPASRRRRLFLRDVLGYPISRSRPTYSSQRGHHQWRGLPSPIKRLELACCQCCRVRNQQFPTSSILSACQKSCLGKFVRAIAATRCARHHCDRGQERVGTSVQIFLCPIVSAGCSRALILRWRRRIDGTANQRKRRVLHPEPFWLRQSA